MTTISRGTFRSLLLSCLVVGAAGCGSGSETQGRQIGALAPTSEELQALIIEPRDLGDDEERFAFQPTDLSTAIFDGNPSVSIPYAFPEASVLGRAELDERVELVTWPERDVVPTSTVFLEGAPEDRDPLRMILVPATSLQDRWYAIRGSVHADSSVAGAVRDGDGRWVSRFRVGHQPIVQVARVTVDDVGNSEVRITYSERINADDVDGWGVDVDGAVADCTLANSAEVLSARGTNVVRIACPRLRDGAHVQLRPVAPLATAYGGHVVVDPDGGEVRPIDLVVRLPAVEDEPVRQEVLGSPLPRVREAARTVSSFGLLR